MADGTRLERGRGASPCRFDSLAFRICALVVKWTSFLASNEAFRVRILVGVLFMTLEPDGQATGSLGHSGPLLANSPPPP
jgi:hypothetical protein